MRRILYVEKDLDCSFITSFFECFGPNIFGIGAHENQGCQISMKGRN